MQRWLAWLALAVAAGCYHPPEPDCGFFCGSGGACPSDYTCASVDGRCHRDTAPAELVCRLDGGGIDAPLDTRADGQLDAPGDDAHADAPTDAPADARADGGVDARPDAPVDARPDAAVDARPDAAAPDAAVDAARPDAAVDAAVVVDAPPDA